MDAADCKQAACCFYKYTKRIFMLKYMININFNTIYVNILQKTKKNIHLKYWNTHTGFIWKRKDT